MQGHPLHRRVSAQYQDASLVYQYLVLSQVIPCLYSWLLVVCKICRQGRACMGTRLPVVGSGDSSPDLQYMD